MGYELSPQGCRLQLPRLREVRHERTWKGKMWGPLLAVACVLLSAPTAALRLTRGEALRSLSAGGAALTLAPLAAFADRGKDLYTSDTALLSKGGAINEAAADANPVYDEEGKLVDAKEVELETSTRALSEGKASVQVLKGWKQSEDGAWVDPVTGSTATSLTMTAMPSSFATITDAGKPETISLVKAFGLESELKRADMVAAAVRKADGITFYDYDLALPAVNCVAELATACLPSKVVLISCGVREGTLHVLRIDASPDQWRRAGTAIKQLRSTFAVEA